MMNRLDKKTELRSLRKLRRPIILKRMVNLMRKDGCRITILNTLLLRYQRRLLMILTMMSLRKKNE